MGVTQSILFTLRRIRERAIKRITIVTMPTIVAVMTVVRGNNERLGYLRPHGVTRMFVNALSARGYEQMKTMIVLSAYLV